MFWNVYARSYDNLAKHFRPYQDLVQEVCDHVDEYADGRSLRILDAGCGTGNYSLELARRGHTVVGVDNSESMLERARKKSSGVENVAFIEHNLTQPLPFGDGEFDAAVSTMVLYALPDPGSALEELRRTTREGGELTLVTSAATSTVWVSLKGIMRTGDFTSSLKTIVALVPVGILNLLIDLSHAKGTYAVSTTEQLRTHLAATRWCVLDEMSAYVEDTALLVIAEAV